MEMIDMFSIKRKLESMRCQKCNKTPTVSVIGDSFDIKACCVPFKKRLQNEVASEINTQGKKYIENQLKNIFK